MNVYESYLKGRVEVEGKIVSSLRKDYRKLKRIKSKFLYNPLKVSNLKARIKVQEELLGINYK